MQESFQFIRAVLIFAAVGVVAAPAVAAERVHLVHAAEVRILGRSAGRVFQWRGDVLARQGDAELRCDWAWLEPAVGAFRARGGVRYTMPDGELRAESLRYTGRVLRAVGAVEWEDEAALIRANEMLHWRDSGRTLAAGEVKLTLARTWFGDSAGGGEDAAEEPILVQADSLWFLPAGDDSGVAEGWSGAASGAADAGYAPAPEARYSARGCVRIAVDGVVAEAWRADFSRRAGWLELREAPVARRDDQEVSAEELVVRLTAGRVAALEAVRDARFRDLRSATDEASPVWDEVAGDSLYLAFEKGLAVDLDVVGQATALFHPESDLRVWNRVAGGRLHIDFDAGEKPLAVRVSRQCAGDYSFPNGAMGGG